MHLVSHSEMSTSVPVSYPGFIKKCRDEESQRQNRHVVQEEEDVDQSGIGTLEDAHSVKGASRYGSQEDDKDQVHQHPWQPTI